MVGSASQCVLWRAGNGCLPHEGECACVCASAAGGGVHVHV